MRKCVHSFWASPVGVKAQEINVSSEEKYRGFVVNPKEDLFLR